MSEGAKQILIEVSTGNDLGPVEGTMGDIEFPKGVLGWTDVLDCRHGRFAEMELEELRHYAEHVRKYYLLMKAS